MKSNNTKKWFLIALMIVLISHLNSCAAVSTSQPQIAPSYTMPTQVIPTWSASDLSNYDPSPSSVLLEANDYYMITDQILICNRLSDVRIWGDGRTIFSHYNGQGREVLEGDLSPQQIQSLLQNLQELGFTGAYTPEEVVPAPVSYYLNVYFKSGKVTRQWNYRPFLVDRFLLQLPFSEFSPYQPQKALLYVGSLGSGGGPSGDSFPEWPSNIGLSLASVPNDGVWVEGDVLRFLWNSINSQTHTPPGFKSAGQYYEVGVEIPGVSMMDVPNKCW